MKHWQSLVGLLATAILQGVNAAPSSILDLFNPSPIPKVTIQSPKASISGIPGDIESFIGIPFAKPPVGSRRLRPPEPITEPLGDIEATHEQCTCPQFFVDANQQFSIVAQLGKWFDAMPTQKALGESEDCLYLSVFRPKGTKPGDKLPVLYWIFGGGFELGWTSMYDIAGPPWVAASVAQNQPIIFVSVGYRVGGFGFMPGKEMKDDGAANIGLLDQRLGMQWVADNIEAFGGDPEKVTIWGESAGSISVYDHTVMYDGDNTYKGKQLFRGGIMNSGTVVPAHDMAHSKPQNIYNRVVEAGGCSGASDTLSCLRGLDYETFLNATNSVNAILDYSSVALSYLPRPDGKTLTASPDELTLAKKYTHVPLIVGDQEDEGTLFSIFQLNITTVQEVGEYLQKYFFTDLTPDLQQELLANYEDDRENGSPFRTGDAYRIYPQFKRLAAVLGDLVFNLSRRVTIGFIEKQSPDIKIWSYLSSYDQGTPLLGTFHGSDILQVIYGLKPNYAADSFKQYYISFVNHGDPNKGVDQSKYRHWPLYSEGHQLLNTYGDHSKLVTDDYRNGSSKFISEHITSFHI